MSVWSWFIYEKYFYYINEGTDKFTEEGFNILNRIAYFIYADPAVMFAIVSLIIYVFIFLAIYQQSNHVCFSILVFFIRGGKKERIIPIVILESIWER